MEAARTSETSVDYYFTRQYIPEDNSELHTRRRENLKSHERCKITKQVEPDVFCLGVYGISAHARNLTPCYPQHFTQEVRIYPFLLSISTPIYAFITERMRKATACPYYLLHLLM
jgi:hypothetical protein